MWAKKVMRSMIRPVLVMAAAITAFTWMNTHMVNADMSPGECQEERKLAANACRPVLYGKSPSASCCERVRAAPVECVCPYISPKVAAIIRAYGLKKIIKLIEGCGRPVPHHVQCGSITIP